MSDAHRVIVVGGGLAGLGAAVRIAESGVPVDLFSMVPVKRSHSVCAQGGINAANDVARQQGYSEYQHFDETIYGGDYLADQGPVLEMANWAPKDDRPARPHGRALQPHKRGPARPPPLRRHRSYKRTHFSGATTGQQLMYALDEQVTPRYEAEGLVTKYEFWEFFPRPGKVELPTEHTAGASASSPRTCARCRSAPSAATRWSWPPAAAGSSSASRPTP